MHYREYFYENADGTLLTGISINGVRHSTYKYYTDKRVSESGLTGGEQLEKFVYGTNYTEVTDARKQTTRYTFATILGNKKLTYVSRNASATCPTAAAKTFYDARGFVDYTLDWNGNKTDYDYDTEGYIKTVVSAAGTLSAATTTYGWVGGKIGSVSTAGAEATYSYRNFGFGAGRVTALLTRDRATGATEQIDYDYTFYPNGTLSGTTVRPYRYT